MSDEEYKMFTDPELVFPDLGGAIQSYTVNVCRETLARAMDAAEKRGRGEGRKAEREDMHRCAKEAIAMMRHVATYLIGLGDNTAASLDLQETAMLFERALLSGGGREG